MKNTLFLIVGIFIIGGSIYLFLEKPAPSGYKEDVTDTNLGLNKAIKIDDVLLTVEVFDTPLERSKGLSERSGLEGGLGALFVFDTLGLYGFWMKDMQFAIDIIWIGEDMKVVGVEKLVRPETFPRIFYPPQPVRHVLETSAGLFDRNSFKIGSTITFI